ncbi:hypothetical protein HanIR_Chr03g0135431 [Helianthus annuus]|nr:hypothetical protein HanIR_Chr03g0135431 [Helianthus annuus]
MHKSFCFTDYFSEEISFKKICASSFPKQIWTSHFYTPLLSHRHPLLQPPPFRNPPLRRLSLLLSASPSVGLLIPSPHHRASTTHLQHRSTVWPPHPVISGDPLHPSPSFNNSTSGDPLSPESPPASFTADLKQQQV